MVTLHSGTLELVLDPALGGSVKSFTHHGINILRPTLPAAQSAGDTAAFPMFPYSGRIANGTFKHDGQHVALSLNKQPEPHTLHGDAWQASWVLDSATTTTATLVHIHTGEPNIWPWAYAAKQIFTVSEDMLTVALAMTNLSNTPMPAGFGWHPYFVREDADLTASVNEFWPVDDVMLPLAPQPLSAQNDLTKGPSVDSLQLDNPFTCADRAASIHWPYLRRTATMTWTEPLDFLVVYTPKGQGFFCVEPVNHTPNSVNSALTPERTGHTALQPGNTLSGTITLQISAN